LTIITREFFENQDYVSISSKPVDNWLYGMILSYEGHMEVLEPPSLREAIQEKAKKILEN